MKKLTTLLLPLLLCTTQASSKEKFSVAIETPSSCEQIQISEIYSDSNSAVVVAKVFKHNKDAMCMMMISSSKDTITLPETLPKQTTVAIVGKNWCWKNQSESAGYTFVKSKAQFDKLIANKNKIFSNPLSKSFYYQGFDAGKNCK